MSERTKMIAESLKYKFANETRNDKHILTLSGPVMGASWFNEDTINRKDIQDALEDVDQDIVIRLNSGGGDVFEGIEIYNYLKDLGNHLTIEVTALAASAASLIAMSADKVVMRTGSSMMIHEASTIAWGNKSEMRKTLNALETVDNSIIDIYAERTNISTSELETLIEDETWMTADEAVEKGFANEKIASKAIREEEPEEEYAASDNVKITDVEELKSVMNDMQKEISAMKNNNASQNQEPKRRLYF